MITKYGFELNNNLLKQNQKRLINQLWKILPMKENEEDWKKQLNSVIGEISGLQNIFNTDINFLILLSKLEGLYTTKDFPTFRKTIFESISLLGELYND